MRNQLRMVVLGVVSVVIVVAWIVEPPGTLEGVGWQWYSSRCSG